MKLKMSFDKNAVKEFLLEHVEKFAFAGIVAAFLALVAGAIWADRYDKEPEDLQTTAENAERFLEEIPPEPDREAVLFARMIRDNRPPREDFYRFPKDLKPRVINPLELRGEPPVLLVRELQGSADYAPFNLRLPSEEGESARRGREMAQGRRGQRWAVITGLVPVRDQERAYEEYFQERIKPTPDPDIPQYIYYRVERAEVDPYLSSSDPEQLEWTTLNLRNALANAEQKWTGTSPEVVDERFVHPVLVFPLGPRLAEQQAQQDYGYAGGGEAMYMDEMVGGGPTGSTGPWGEEVAHPPEIPLKRQGFEGEMEDEMMPGEDADEVSPDGPDVPDFDLPMRGEGGMGPGGMRPGFRRPPGDSEFMGEGGMRQPGPDGRMGEYAGEGMGMYDQMPEHLLFRFFDYTVEYGKSYRYRVRLMLANPNYGIDPKFLEDPAMAEKRWIEKDRWSEPSPVITVPRDTYVLAGGVHTQIRPTDEPSGSIAVVKWREATGEEVHKDFRVTRGQQLDYEDVVIRDPRRSRYAAAEEIPSTGGLLGLGEQETPVEEPEEVDFITEMLVLDLKGGIRLPGRDRSLTEPGRILVMDYDGTLRMLSEIEDSREFEERTSEPEPPEEEGTMPGMMDEEAMMEEMMMLEGGPPPPRGRRTPRREAP